jgi:glutathione S-transferase
MLELYQFELSHYAEKIRLVLDYKGLAYRKIEVTPGIGQLDLMRLSGQRQVPVLKDGSQVIADSTAIAEYLDKTYPDRPIIPTEPKLRGLCLLLEQWADEVLGWDARKAMIGAMNQDPSFRTAFLPTTVPAPLKSLIGAVPGTVLGSLNQGVGLGPEGARRSLTALCEMLLTQPYLVTDHPTLADFAVAGLSLYLKFPSGNYLDIPESLKGKGVAGIADVAAFEPFFTWRDKLYADYRTSSTPPPPTGQGPQSISID